MNVSASSALIIAILLAIIASNVAQAVDHSKQSEEQARALISSASIGLLGKPIGTVLTIEGTVTPDTSQNYDSQLFVVDTVNSKKLDHPVSIEIINPILPAQERCVLRGYEYGKWLGMPSEIDKSIDEAKFYHPQSIPWHFYHFFRVIEVESPAGKKQVNKSYMGWSLPFSVASSSDPCQIGRTGKPIGTYLTVEGLLHGIGSMNDPRTITIDKINSQSLKKPISMPWGCRLIKQPPEDIRCVFKGFETGEWIGNPPEVEVIMSQKSPDYIGLQAVWQFAVRFEITSFESSTAESKSTL